MAYKTFASINIAVIGDGKVGKALARGLAIADHNIFIGIKEEYTSISEDFFSELSNVVLTSIDYAAAIADIIFITTPAANVREAAYLLDDVRHKVIVDMSGFNASSDDLLLHTANAIHSITYSPNVVKCYTENGYMSLKNLFRVKSRDEVYVAGDSKKSKEIVKLLMRDIGFLNCSDMGGSDNIKLIDEMIVLADFKSAKELVVVERR